jgi:hypothetical protein
MSCAESLLNWCIIPINCYEFIESRSLAKLFGDCDRKQPQGWKTILGLTYNIYTLTKYQMVIQQKKQIDLLHLMHHILSTFDYQNDDSGIHRKRGLYEEMDLITMSKQSF